MMMAFLSKLATKSKAAISAQANLRLQVKPQSCGRSQNLLKSQGVPA